MATTEWSVANQTTSDGTDTVEGAVVVEVTLAGSALAVADAKQSNKIRYATVHEITDDTDRRARAICPLKIITPLPASRLCDGYRFARSVPRSIRIHWPPKAVNPELDARIIELLLTLASPSLLTLTLPSLDRMFLFYVGINTDSLDGFLFIDEPIEPYRVVPLKVNAIGVGDRDQDLAMTPTLVIR